MEKAGRPPGFFFWEARPGQPGLPGNGGCEHASSHVQYPPPASPFAKVTTICERELPQHRDLSVHTGDGSGRHLGSCAPRCCWCVVDRASCSFRLTRSQERGPDTPAGVCCALCRLPTDKGYQGAGIGVHTPIKGFHLEIDSRAYNALVSGMCAIGERSNALLGQRWAALRHVSLSPSRIGDIVAAALVPTSRERGTR